MGRAPSERVSSGQLGATTESPPQLEKSMIASSGTAESISQDGRMAGPAKDTPRKPSRTPPKGVEIIDLVDYPDVFLTDHFARVVPPPKAKVEDPISDDDDVIFVRSCPLRDSAGRVSGQSQDRPVKSEPLDHDYKQAPVDKPDEKTSIPEPLWKTLKQEVDPASIREVSIGAKGTGKLMKAGSERPIDSEPLQLPSEVPARPVPKPALLSAIKTRLARQQAVAAQNIKLQRAETQVNESGNAKYASGIFSAAFDQAKANEQARKSDAASQARRPVKTLEVPKTQNGAHDPDVPRVNKVDITEPALATAPNHQEHANAPDAFDPTTEDHSWMNQELEDDSDDADQEARVHELATRNIQKELAGTLTPDDIIELTKAKIQQSIRTRRRAAAENQIPVEEPLFVPQDGDEPASAWGQTPESLAHLASPGGKRKRKVETGDAPKKVKTHHAPTVEDDTVMEDAILPGDTDQKDRPATDGNIVDKPLPKTKKAAGRKTAPRPQNAREFHDAEKEKKAAKEQARMEKIQVQNAKRVARDAKVAAKKEEKAQAREAKKAAKQAEGPKKPRKGDKRGKANGAAGVGRAAKAAPNGKAPARAKGKQAERPNAKKDMLMNLLANDPIRDRLQMGDLPPEVDHTNSTKKGSILNDLIASVPADVNKRQVTNRRSELWRATKCFGNAKVHATPEGRWRVAGLKTPLMHHQLLGAQWMLGRECAERVPKGGLLADTMGFGKTIQMLATMIGNPPQKDDHGLKTTLLVVPSSILHQWLDEIKKHVRPGIFKKVMVYKSADEMTMANLLDQDVLNPPLDNNPNQELDPEAVAARFAERMNQRGDLHRIKFYRVVLDEAHTIKNYWKRTSLACQNLDAQYRWALSATPIQNRIDELYPYINFLKMKYAGDFRTFQKCFCGEDEGSTTRVIHLLSVMMIRRTLKDKIFHKPIVRFPNTHPDLKIVEFGKTERFLYESLEDMFRRDLNEQLKDGTIAKNHRHVLVMLLRLRQATAHPFLLQQTIAEHFSLEDLRRLQRKIQKAAEQDAPNTQIVEWVQANVDQAEQERAAGKAARMTPSTSSFGNSSFGTDVPMEKYWKTLNEEKLLERCMCHICDDMAVEAQITDCSHVFCLACILHTCQESAAAGEAYTKCPECQHAFSGLTPYTLLQANVDPARSASPAADTNEDAGRKGRGKKSKDLWMNQSGDLLPSAKTIALKAQILDWMKDGPNDKIIIFTQWRLMTKIIERMCRDEGWKTCKEYSGDMATKKRHEEVKKFEDPDSDYQIMIVGLKCGGQGLNLNVANRVFSVDLWWNHSVELQAFGRVFRIGQLKETYFTRVVVKNSVDDRMLKMQNEKIRIIDNAMADDGHETKKLTTEELLSLFGCLKTDSDGNQCVVPDNEAPPEEEEAAKDDGHADADTADATADADVDAPAAAAEEAEADTDAETEADVEASTEAGVETDVEADVEAEIDVQVISDTEMDANEEPVGAC
ncbi:MAG: hypothetical protein M1838_001763 [Thelocarpon superellum]|nr:MAG: hypothetical protein M1838_001763 [Thelocarpon superellum]